MESNRNITSEIYKLDENETAELTRIYEEGLLEQISCVDPHGWLVWSREVEIPHQLRTDDIWILGLPKTGTTWTEELVWLIANDFDYKTAKSVPLLKRSLFTGYFPVTTLTGSILKQDCQGDIRSQLKMMEESQWNDRLDSISKMPSPRFLKSHLPFSLLPINILEKTKVVYVARDPRDVAVSLFHYLKLRRIIYKKVEFKESWQLFKKNMLVYTPYFTHFQEAWKLKDHPNMLFLFYEELSKDLPDVVRRVAKFLGKAVTEEQVAGLCEHLRFKNFKQNKMVNLDVVFDQYRELGVVGKDEHFIRKGIVGGWRDYFDEDMAKEAELWMEEGLRGIDFRFEN